MATRSIELREADRPQLHVLPRELAVAIASRRIATVDPTGTPDTYLVSGVRKVGVLNLAGHTLRLRPKTPVSRLFAILAYSRSAADLWRDDDVRFGEHDDVVTAIAHPFVRVAERALAGGSLKGYVTRDESLPLVRGRWRIGDQITRRAGQPLPVEVSFDDYLADIAENRLVKSAAERLLRMPELPRELVAALRRIVAVLDDVTSIAPGAALPRVAVNRRNRRYADALVVSRLILEGTSIEHRDGRVIGSAFLVDMWAVFEDFVSAVLTDLFGSHGGSVTAQYSSTLDHDQAVQIKPDLVWLDGRSVRACLDVKYKVEKHGQFPNADIYQMAAYCRRFGLAEGHLVYAAGDSVPSAIRVVDGPTIHQHALDLSKSIADIVAQLAVIADSVAKSSDAPLRLAQT